MGVRDLCCFEGKRVAYLKKEKGVEIFVHVVWGGKGGISGPGLEVSVFPFNGRPINELQKEK